MASLRQRGSTYYIQYYIGGSQRRVSTGTDSYQIAQEKLRQFESAQFRGDDNPLPTRTPIAQIVGQYVADIRTTKTAKSAQTDIYYLRDAFGLICDELKVTSRKLSSNAKKRPPKEGQDRRRRALVIEAPPPHQLPRRDILRPIQNLFALAHDSAPSAPSSKPSAIRSTRYRSAKSFFDQYSFASLRKLRRTSPRFGRLSRAA
jgi:hypothetical protein